MLNIDDYFKSFKYFVLDCENIELEQDNQVKRAFKKTSVYAENLKPYLNCDEFCELVNNLWLHFYIIDSNKDSVLYTKYDVGSTSVLVTSTSAGGSSASMEVPRTISEGDLFTFDLYRTPYGRFALTILESLKHIALVRL